MGSDLHYSGYSVGRSLEAVDGPHAPNRLDRYRYLSSGDRAPVVVEEKEGAFLIKGTAYHRVARGLPR